MTENLLYNFVKKHQISKFTFVSYVIALTIILYFGFFTIFGAKGVLQLRVLQGQINNKEITRQETLDRMQAKKNLVDGMKPESLDIDLLDEQARKVLGYAGKNEVIIFQNKDN